MREQYRKKLESCARRVLQAEHGGAPKALTEDGISICEWASRELGIELTVEEGGLVRDMADKMTCSNCGDAIPKGRADFCCDHCANQSRGEECKGKCKICKDNTVP